MTKEVVEKKNTIEEVKSNLEHQVKAIDSKVEKATARVDKLMIQRNILAGLLEKVNRVNVES